MNFLPFEEGAKLESLAQILRLEDIAAATDRRSFLRGQDCQREGMVVDIWLSRDLRNISGSVEGSSGLPYHQNILLSEVKGSPRLHITGKCSCPMRLNCKHVAAVLLEVIERAAEKPAGVHGPAAPPSLERGPSPVDPMLPYDLKVWLDELANSSRGDAYPPDIPMRVLYVLSPSPLPSPTKHLAVDVLAARVLKSGSYSKSPTRPSLGNLRTGDAPKYFRQSDVEICRALLVSHPVTSLSSYPVRFFSLVQQMIATGRAFWLSLDNPFAFLGEARPGSIEWTMQDARGLRPVLTVEGAIALNCEPPVYVDEQNGLLGEVQLPLPPAVAYRLLCAPVVPSTYVEQVGEALAHHLSSAPQMIPQPPEPPVVVDESPVPRLRLFVARDAPGLPYRSEASRLLLARLSFRYGSVQVASQDQQTATAEIFQGGRRYRVKRRFAAESGFAAQLQGLGLQSAREVYPYLIPEYRSDRTLMPESEWLNFLYKWVPVLREAGFEVQVDDDFPYQVVGADGDLEADLFQGEGLDWLELSLGVQVEGERLELAPILAGLLAKNHFSFDDWRTMEEEAGTVFLALPDGRSLALAVQKFLPIIRALHELSRGGAHIDAKGRLKISKAEAVLAGTIGQDTGLALGVSDQLRQLFRALGGGLAALPPPALPPEFTATLRPYQQAGVAWLNTLREAGLGGVLADDMGLGKTVQILALLSLEKAEGRLQAPALIIAPTSLMTNWQNEAQRFAPQLRVLLLHGSTRKERFDEIARHDIVLTTYPLIARDQQVLLEQRWHLAILDEAQTIKNPNAATTQLIRDLRATHRFCLTGTPVENHLGELWSLMSFVLPGYLGDKSGFSRRWRTPIERHSNRDVARLLARRVRPFLLRRTKQEVASELPPKTEVTENIVLDDEQRRMYDAVRLSMHEKVRQAIAAKGFAKSRIVILDALLKLRQVCCDPRLLRLELNKDAGQPVAGSAKLNRLSEMLDELLSEGRKVIVFSQFTSMLRLIADRLRTQKIEFALLTGQTKDRKTAVETFQEGRVPVFLISLKAGGVGLNLTAADTVILYDPWWNPAAEQQAIDRAHRIGQDKPVFIYRLIAQQTIEGKMDELKAKKRALAESLYDPEADPTSLFSEGDVDSLFDS